ncbi:hypothetical protein [Hymenobacter sp. HDW8]|uniref:hypothetical protein n=1 Tax=Hymenobacter sp. HDW8 TaxID=2714932 RepID=UPI00140E4AD2|nr:hypothetical protein [Hymenobacter sp. HDW8]QIL78370.1 hypothetical protein G7064_21380 [Hymenobacter sp. HDW8]
MRSPALLVPLFFLLLGCGGENASPKNAVPANSASVKIDGVAFPVDISRSKVQLTASTGELAVILQTSQPSGPRVVMVLSEFHQRPEKFTLPSQSTSVIDLSELPTGGLYYSSRDCNPVGREIEILTYNAAARTVSGRFSGKMCAGFGAQTNKASKMATEGQFNLPFQLQ